MFESQLNEIGREIDENLPNYPFFVKKIFVLKFGYYETGTIQSKYNKVSKVFEPTNKIKEF